MSILGSAAVAMWWDMSTNQRAEFQDWHSHEHFPERMSIPGFLRGSRWASTENAEGFFVLYELAAYETLVSQHYLARLNNPTPWSVKMMPQHRNMMRSQCRTIESFGGGIARSMLTLRLSPEAGKEYALQQYLRSILEALPEKPGITGAHLLQTQTPDLAPTTEQLIRGSKDAVADWIVLLSGYDEGALEEILTGSLGSSALVEAGAKPAQSTSMFELSFSMAASDLIRP